MKYHIITLGCPKNAVDSEGMGGILAAQGHMPVAQPADADVVIVNTCSFIAAARDETLGVLREMAAGKTAGQRLAAPGDYADWRTAPIKRHVQGPSAYLKISDGCNLRCAFCTIPSFKGDMRSKAMGGILGEAQELAAQGVKEIVLVAQHLTDYGRDLKIKDGLATLLEELCGVLPEDTWLRLMYAYPHGISDQLIATMARHPQICAYLDMPLQHAHPDTLRRMRRPPDTDRTKGIIRDLRAAMPDIALRSTFIVGFPGETREEFTALQSFLEEVQLDRVGVFRYSQEPGTPAATLPSQVAARVIERRWNEVMQLQQRVSLARNQRWDGRTIRMLVEGQGTSDDGAPLVVGRSFRDAPEVDGQVFAWGVAQPGSFVNVRVTQALEYDLWGELVTRSQDDRVT